MLQSWKDGSNYQPSSERVIDKPLDHLSASNSPLRDALKNKASQGLVRNQGRKLNAGCSNCIIVIAQKTQPHFVKRNGQIYMHLASKRQQTSYRIYIRCASLARTPVMASYPTPTDAMGYRKCGKCSSNAWYARSKVYRLSKRRSKVCCSQSVNRPKCDVKWVYKKKRCGFINYLRFEIEVRIRKEVTKNLCRGGRNCEVSAGEDVYITSWVGLRGRI